LSLDFHPVDTSQSELKSWRRCPLKWFFKHCWRLRPTHTGRALAIGSMVHDTLAEWSEPPNSAEIRTCELLLEIFKDVYREKVASDFTDPDFEVYKLVYRVLIQYHQLYGPSWDFLLVEEDFRIPIFLREQLIGFVHGRFDGLVRHTDDKIWVIEHKTTKRFSFDHLAIDAQADLYALAGSKLFGEAFGGLWYDFIRSKPSRKNPNFCRIKVRRSSAALRAIEQWIAATMINMARAQPELLAPVFDRDCFWFCDYLNLCHSIRAGVPLKSAIEGDFRIRERVPEEVYHG